MKKYINLLANRRSIFGSFLFVLLFLFSFSPKTFTGQTITTGTITGSPFCACAAVSVPFTITGTFTAGNTFTAQLSSATGSFAAPITIGTLAGTAAGTITCTIPCNTAAGVGYIIRVIGSTPSITGSSSAAIRIVGPRVATFSYTASPYCQNAANPLPTFSGGGVAGIFSSTPGFVFISTTTGQINLAGSNTGTYTVTNTLAATSAANGSCPAVTATSPVTINPAQDASFTYPASAFCKTSANPTPTITGTPGGTFTSSPAGLVFVSATTGQINLTTSTSGIYTITYTTPGPLCINTSTASVTITTPKVATFSYTGSPYCQNASNPLPTYTGGGVAGTFSSTAGLVFTSTSTGQINLAGSNASTYTVTNTIAATGGCPAISATSTIVINPTQDSSFHYTGSPFCKTGANPTPTITGTSGGTFTSTPAGLVFVSSSTGVINLATSTAGTYNVKYTTPGPCQTTLTVPITITAPAVATFSYTGTPYCQNSANPSPTFSGGGVAGTFSSTAGLVFLNTNTGQVNLSASNASTYTVTNTLPATGGCPVITATSSIVINPTQDSSFHYTGSTFCKTGTNPTPVITGTPGGTFTATPAGLAFVSASTGVINLATTAVGIYNIKYTTPGPCPTSLTVSVTITAANVATFSYTGSPYCQNAANPLPAFSGGGVAGTFSSTAGLVFLSTSTGQVNLSASNASTYTVTNTIAASGGCNAVSATSTIVINPTQDSTFSYSSNSFCKSGTNPIPTITGTSGGTFTSTPVGLVFVTPIVNPGEINLTASAAGTYSITYTTPGPCATHLTVSITITAPSVATFSYSGSPYCSNAANPSPVLGAGASAGLFSSTAGLVFLNTATGQINLTTSTAGSYTVTNTIAASGGCPSTSATDTITITTVSTGNFSYTNTPYCINSANPTPVLGAGSIAGTFSSTAGLIFSNTSTGQVNLSGSNASTYTVTNTIPASGGCPVVTSTSSITITTPAVGTFSYTATPYCQNAANPSPVFNGGGVAGTFSSTGGLSITAGSGLVNLATSNAGTYVVTNTIAASGGCAATQDTSSITIVANPSVSVNSPTVCSGLVTTLTANGATSYIWSAGATSTGTNTATVSPANTTSYTVTGTTSGCSATAVSTVTTNNCHLVPGFSADHTTICSSGCVTFTDLTTGSPTNWTWLFPGGIPSTSNSSGPVTVCFDSVMNYTVSLIVSNSASTDTIIKPDYIHVVQSTPVTITGNTSINSCESTQLTALPAGISYLWGPDIALQCNTCQTATISATATQQYYVTYTDLNGCTSADTTIVNVTGIYAYFMPTGFSPNGDGNNDVLYVKGRGIDFIDLIIYDRIGEKVFETTSTDNGWDGTLNGVLMNSNSFDYILEVTYCNGQTVSEKGTLALIR